MLDNPRHTIDQAADRLQSQHQRIAILTEVLIECARTFREYERLHRAKGTAEGPEKAERNAVIASRAELAIACAGHCGTTTFANLGASEPVAPLDAGRMEADDLNVAEMKGLILRLDAVLDAHVAERGTLVGFSEAMSALTAVAGQRIWSNALSAGGMFSGVKIAAKHILRSAVAAGGVALEVHDVELAIDATATAPMGASEVIN